MTTQTTETNYDAFDAGQEVQEQQVESIGFRRLQHMNENTTYHRGTTIERGGYAIDDDDGDAPEIGPSETIKHYPTGSTIMRVTQEVDLAVIGFSQKYWQVEYDDPSGTLDGVGNVRKVRFISGSHVYSENLPTNGKCISCSSLFVVLKNDPKRELYELTFKSFNSDEGTKLINALKAAAATVAQELAVQRGKTTKLHIFALWMTLGVGETQMKGAKVQGPSTPPTWKVDTAPASLMARLVSGDDYKAFIALRKELDDYLAQGRYSGGGGGGAQRPQAQIAAPTPQPTPVAQLDPAISANGDVSV